MSREKWARAREIINRHDDAFWGANFYHHAEVFQEIFPELQTARELFETQFQHLIRLLKFSAKKIQKAGTGKSIRALAFGHEDYLAYALDRYFENHQIGNCETIHFQIDNGGRSKALVCGI